MRKLLFRYNLMWLLFAFMLLPCILAIIVMIGSARSIPKWMAHDYKLGGFTKELKAPPFDLVHLKSHDLQKYIETWTSNHLPLRSLLIRLNNQIFYTFFHKSHSDLVGLIVGKSRELFEIAYINSYCGLIPMDFRNSTKLTQWANQIKELSDFFEKRGKTFIYVITPSKVEYIPHALPERFRCKKENGISPHIKELERLLSERKVSYINGSSLMVSATKEYGTSMFPRGGIHWNHLAASLESNKVIDAINKKGNVHLHPLRFSYEMINEPEGQDKDLMTLLNVFRPDDNYSVPKMTYVKHGANKPIKAAVIGGSFLEKMLDIFNENKTFSNISFYRYFKLDKIDYAYTDKKVKPLKNAPSAKDLAPIFAADVVLLEENSEITVSEHGRMLYETIKKFEKRV